MKNKYQPTYWNNKGKFEKEYNFICTYFIPPEGSAYNLDAELVRCVSRIYYDIYNNDGCNLYNYQYFIEFVKEHIPDNIDKKKFNNVVGGIHALQDEENCYELDDLNSNFKPDLDYVVDVIVEMVYNKLIEVKHDEKVIL